MYILINFSKIMTEKHVKRLKNIIKVKYREVVVRKCETQGGINEVFKTQRSSCALCQTRGKLCNSFSFIQNLVRYMYHTNE